jgi:Icc-related predicted phosphoesterase
MLAVNDVKIVAISDIHGQLPESLPPCDLLLIAGDICPLTDHEPRAQANWLATEFRAWLDRQRAAQVVATWGNHDFVGELAPHLVPPLRWQMLVDQAIEVLGLKIYGSPWQPRFFDWAFNLDEPDLEKRWQRIPSGIDILLLHGPPYGYGDLAGPNRFHPQGEHTGSPSLTRRILEVRPQLAVFGHIHEAFGVYELENVVLANVSVLNARYELVNRPFEAVLRARAPSP